MSYAKLELEIMRSREVNQTAKIIYSAIASHYRNKKSRIFPSYNRLADMAGVSRITAIRAVQSLVSAGFIVKTLRKNGSETNLYTINTSIKTDTSIKNDTPTGIKNDTPTGIKNDTPNKDSLKEIYNKNKQKASGSAQRDPELSGEQQQITAITSKMRNLLGKGFEWVEAVEYNGKLYLRYSSPVSKNYFNKTRIAETTSFFLTEYGQAPEPLILEHNQAREIGVIL